MKRLVYIISGLVLLMSLLFAGCGSAPGAESGGKATTPPAPPKAGAAPAKAAWEEKWNNTLAAAKKEGTVVIYGFVGPELRDELTTAFKKEFGIELEFVVGKGAEVSTRFMAEWNSGINAADIMLFGASTFLTNLDPGLVLDQIEPLLIRPEVVDPRAWRDGKLPFVDSGRKVIPLTTSVLQYLLVNTDQVKPGQIKAYRDLLQPQWKGKIVMFDPTISGTANGWVTLILTKAYGTGEGEKFLRQFVTQEPLITKDSRLQIEWLARGRYPVTIAVDTQAAYSMHKAGGPITRLSAEEGGILSGGGAHLGIPLKRAHPNGTAVLVNWLLGPTGQQIYSKGFGAPATRLGVASEGVSQLALPLPGEKLFQDDEKHIMAYGNAREVAKVIFGPLIK